MSGAADAAAPADLLHEALSSMSETAEAMAEGLTLLREEAGSCEAQQAGLAPRLFMLVRLFEALRVDVKTAQLKADLAWLAWPRSEPVKKSASAAADMVKDIARLLPSQG